ncbi:MAG: cytidylate kinase-like family protein [Lachnospiraceae bacterium]|nr:cytidylate kinase-like family protein [Lachnospiraceae bacterium]
MKKSKVITITRQFGSLGRPIGKIVAEKLGYRYLDRDILEATAEKMDVSLHSLIALDNRGISGYHKMAYPLGIGDGIRQEKMFKIQSELIQKYASQENCVIIGRCSDYILREFDNVLSCYIYSPYVRRIENSVDELGFTAAESKIIVDEIDRARAQYYKHYTHCEFNTTCFRDLLINSSVLGVEGTADMIVQFARKKFDLT